MHWLKFILNPDLWEVLGSIWAGLAQLLPPQGLYESLTYEVQLELCDPQGKKAIVHKNQQVKFLQNHVFAFQDQVWGEGDIFAEYKSSVGVPVDRFLDGNRWRVLIALHDTKNRGDVETFQIERHIRRGFTHPTEHFQTKLDHHTHQLDLEIIFPKNRPPKKVWGIEENRGRSTLLSGEQIQTVPDGRQQVRWHLTHPRRYEMYSLRWVW